MKTTKTKLRKGEYLVTKGSISYMVYLNEFGRWEMRNANTDEWAGDFKTLKRAVKSVDRL